MTCQVCASWAGFSPALIAKAHETARATVMRVGAQLESDMVWKKETIDRMATEFSECGGVLKPAGDPDLTPRHEDCKHTVDCRECAEEVKPDHPEARGAGREPAGEWPSDEQLAQNFHEVYERLAPSFGYETRKASAKPWLDVPENNRRLMIAVCQEILASLQPSPDLLAAREEIERLKAGSIESEYAQQRCGFCWCSIGAQPHKPGCMRDAYVEMESERDAALAKAAELKAHFVACGECSDCLEESGVSVPPSESEENAQLEAALAQARFALAEVKAERAAALAKYDALRQKIEGVREWIEDFRSQSQEAFRLTQVQDALSKLLWLLAEEVDPK